jgi:hypothetical protein
MAHCAWATQWQAQLAKAFFYLGKLSNISSTVTILIHLGNIFQTPQLDPPETAMQTFIGTFLNI